MLCICVVWTVSQLSRCGQRTGDRIWTLMLTWPLTPAAVRLHSWCLYKQLKNKSSSGHCRSVTEMLRPSNLSSVTVKPHNRKYTCHSFWRHHQVQPGRKNPDSPDPDPIKHPWDMPEQVWTLEVPCVWSWFWPIKVPTHMLWGGAKDLRCRGVNLGFEFPTSQSINQASMGHTGTDPIHGGPTMDPDPDP